MPQPKGNKRRKKPERIFSGESSKRMWKQINDLREHSPRVRDVAYDLGCRCQGLEAIVRRLEEKLDALTSE